MEEGATTLNAVNGQIACRFHARDLHLVMGPAAPGSPVRCRVPGPDPQGRPYQTYASFSDPDGNGWLLQVIKTRLPGREWED